MGRPPFKTSGESYKAGRLPRDLQFQHEIDCPFDTWGGDGPGGAGFPAVNLGG